MQKVVKVLLIAAIIIFGLFAAVFIGMLTLESASNAAPTSPAPAFEQKVRDRVGKALLVISKPMPAENQP